MSALSFELKIFTHVWHFNHNCLFQYLMSDTNPVERLATRAGNARQHPGRVSQPRKRRTKEEMARDKAIAEEKKERKKRQQTKGIARIAELEDRMAIDDAGVEGAHPRNQKGSLSCAFFRLTGLLLF